VHPFSIPFDPENVNVLVDIAVASGNDVVSSLKGNLISAINFETVKSVDKIILENNRLRFINKNAAKAAENHRSSLRKLCLERPEISDILEKRISSLSSSCISFHIPEGIDYFSKSQQLDEGIRIISSVVSNSWTSEKILEDVYESLQASLKSLVSTCLL
jgi:hypothetical protein